MVNTFTFHAYIIFLILTFQNVITDSGFFIYFFNLEIYIHFSTTTLKCQVQKRSGKKGRIHVYTKWGKELKQFKAAMTTL